VAGERSDAQRGLSLLASPGTAAQGAALIETAAAAGDAAATLSLA
jgi:hypothetical protein